MTAIEEAMELRRLADLIDPPQIAVLPETRAVAAAAMRAAADRLAELEKAEPVAWRYRFHTDDFLAGKTNVRPWLVQTVPVQQGDDIEIEPLYTHPAAAPPFARDSWQHAVDDHLSALGRTSQEFANPHEAVKWLLETVVGAHAAPQVPAGWQMAPLWPTTEMRIAGFESPAWDELSTAVLRKKGWPYSCKQSAECVGAIYRAMLSAAPSAQVPAMRMLTDEEMRDAAHGKYGLKEWRAVISAFCEVNGIAAPKEPTPPAGTDGVPPTDEALERHAAALGRTGPLGRAISVLQDVLTDIEDWEDKALAEAVTDARRGLLMMLEAEKLKRAANPVPRVVASGVGGFGDAEQ